MSKPAADKGRIAYSAATTTTLSPSTVIRVRNTLHFVSKDVVCYSVCSPSKDLLEFICSGQQESVLEHHVSFHHLSWFNTTNSLFRCIFHKKIQKISFSLQSRSIIFLVNQPELLIQPLWTCVISVSFFKIHFQFIRFIWLFIRKYFLKDYDCGQPDFIIFLPQTHLLDSYNNTLPQYCSVIGLNFLGGYHKSLNF